MPVKNIKRRTNDGLQGIIVGLTDEEKQALIKDGASVSPCLNLMNMEDITVRTSITEEEKTNLEKGLYNSVFYADLSLGQVADNSVFFPEPLVQIENRHIFSFYTFSFDETTQKVSIDGTTTKNIQVGEKNADGTYKITVNDEFNEAIPFGSGGGGNSLTLELTDFSTGEPITRTSITEEEKTNLEEGKYGFISYYDLSWGDTGEYIVMFPQLLGRFQGMYFAIIYNVSVPNDVPSISGLFAYTIEIGEKSTDGTYPITIKKAVEMPFAGGGGGTVEVITATKTSNPEFEEMGFTAINLDKVPTSSQFILSYANESILMYKDADGLYTGASFASLYSAGLSYALVNVDSSGNASGAFRKYDVSFLNDMKRENEGKVLTIESTGHAFFEMPPRYEHTVTLKTSAGKILWTQTMRNSSNTVVNSYANLKTLFGGAIYAGFGEYCQLNLRGGTEATDKLIKLDGTEATLASLGAIVYTDVCFLPK